MKSKDNFDLVYYMTHKKYGEATYRDGSSIIILFELDDEYVKQIEPDYPDMLCTQIEYFLDTLTVKAKGYYLKCGHVNVGIWEYYNETGKLVRTVDADEHFPVKWEQMEQILKDRDISLLTADSIFRYYDEEKDLATWSIIIKLPMEKGCLYVFDAGTGELLEKKIISMQKEI